MALYKLIMTKESVQRRELPMFRIEVEEHIAVFIFHGPDHLPIAWSSFYRPLVFSRTRLERKSLLLAKSVER